jgi:hypothetical protein
MEQQCKTGALKWLKMSEIEETEEKIKQKLFDMYKARPLSTPITDKDQLFNYYPCNINILCSDSGNEIYGGIMWWQSEYGNKISTSFSINPAIYKEHIIPKYKELLETPGYYAELSEALEYLLRKNGLENIKNKEVIKTVLGSLVKEEDILMADDPRLEKYKLGKNPSPPGSYLRIIEGVGTERKALYGQPCMSKDFNGEECDRTCTTLSGGSLRKNKRKSKKFSRKNLRKNKRKSKKYSRKNLRKNKRKSKKNLRKKIWIRSAF